MKVVIGFGHGMGFAAWIDGDGTPAWGIHGGDDLDWVLI